MIAHDAARLGTVRAMRRAVCPGSYDPATNGHLDIIERAAKVFDTLVVAVLANPRKAALLDVETRIEVIRAALVEAAVPSERIEVEAYDGLTVELCRARGAGSIVRGLRAISDFETEMQLAHNNRVLAPGVDTVFFMTSVASGYVSSSLVKEIAAFGGDVSTMVPAPARLALAATLPTR
jgi:pantetheine-phosphate adenylyltransferase